MWRAKRSERFATVGRLKKTFRAGVYDICIGWISAERGVVERTLNQCALRINQRPGLTCVLRTVKAATGFGFDQGVNAIRIGCSYCQVGLTDEISGKSVADLGEVVSAI